MAEESPVRQGWVQGVCDVHRLVDKDLGERRVGYCSQCDAYMCDECRGNVVKRAQAWMLRGWERFKG